MFLNISGLYSIRLKTIDYLKSYLHTSKVSTQYHTLCFTAIPFPHFPGSEEIRYEVLPSSQFLVYANSVSPKFLSSFDRPNSVAPPVA